MYVKTMGTTEISPVHLDPIYKYFDCSLLGNDNCGKRIENINNKRKYQLY